MKERKNIKITSKKIESRITAVTLALGIVVINVIWIAGFKTEKVTEPVYTQNKPKAEINKTTKKTAAFSLRRTNLKY